MGDEPEHNSGPIFFAVKLKTKLKHLNHEFKKMRTMAKQKTCKGQDHEMNISKRHENLKLRLRLNEEELEGERGRKYLG